MFSSAFVVLARSVGIPARVVSGWAIGQTDDEQIVYLDQAHQWAEVALDGIGWVTFEPTPEGGPPSRTEGFYPGDHDGSGGGGGSGGSGSGSGGSGGGGGGSGGFGDGFTISESALREIAEKIDDALETLRGDRARGTFLLGQVLGDIRPGYGEAADKILEWRGGSFTGLETGSSLVTVGDQGYAVPGTTTAQSPRPSKNEIFQVHGASHTNYLRTAVGDRYEDGRWHVVNSHEFSVSPNRNVPQWVKRSLDGHLATLYPPERLEPALLAGFQTTPTATQTDSIRLTTIDSIEEFSFGTLPTSLHLQEIDVNSSYLLHSVVYTEWEPVAEHTWTSKIPVYSEAQLRRAVVSSDSTYTQLPPSVPDRVRHRALEVTQGYDSPLREGQGLGAVSQFHIRLQVCRFP